MVHEFWLADIREPVHHGPGPADTLGGARVDVDTGQPSTSAQRPRGSSPQLITGGLATAILSAAEAVHAEPLAKAQAGWPSAPDP